MPYKSVIMLRKIIYTEYSNYFWGHGAKEGTHLPTLMYVEEVLLSFSAT